MRQIVLDTETTGLETSLGHRVIEIGCVELVNRRITGNHWHHYFNPEREVDPGAFEVHGLGNDFLADKPRFAELARDFRDYVSGAELVIHNAPFDIGFLDYELSLLDPPLGALGSDCAVLDTLVLARRRHPGQKNSLDALCKRYDIDNSQRSLHGALLDARILADVYLAMTGGQTSLGLEAEQGAELRPESPEAGRIEAAADLPAWRPGEDALAADRAYAEFLRTAHDDPAWR